ncbi:MAG: TRM11 family SAM-dependent methyltransferase, partial [Polyangiaceae bacterium]
LMIDRTRLRPSAASPSIDASRTPSRPLALRFRCRAGLAPLVASELDGSFAPKIASPSAVDAVLTRALDACFMSRCALDFGFVVPPEPVLDGDIAGAVVRGLVSARSILAELEPPPHRFRISWSEGGHKRGAVWKIAEAARAASADLVNDPTASAWEVVVREKSHKKGDPLDIDLLLVPSSLADPRFSYRVADVPAASHPTLAAALARVAGARDDDVVWDPFVGSGTELIERAKIGKFARAFGTDTDERALKAARENLKAAGVSAGVISGDALSHRAEDVSLVITNPPMGRRVHRGADLHVLLDRFLDHAASVLVPGGRIAWISPLPARTAEHAKKLGLVQERGIEVDMGGFSGQIQLLSRPRRKSK